MMDVLLVDDHPVMRQLLREMLENHADVTVIGEVSSGEDAVSEATKLQPSVVIMDVNLPTMNGVQATQLIKHGSPFTAVIGLTALEQGHMEQAMIAAGAAALINKGEVFGSLYPTMLEAVKRLRSSV